MGVLSEIELRARLKDLTKASSYHVPAGTIITPAARTFLSDHGIKLIVEENEASRVPKDPPSPSGDIESSRQIPSNEDGATRKTSASRYLLLDAQVEIDNKPEAYTHLRGNLLVPKTHPRIRFRGRMDSLEGRILMAQIRANKTGITSLVEDLGEILDTVRKVLRAEVLDEKLSIKELLGLSEDEIREISHNPRKTLGVEHFMPSWNMGEMMAVLNMIRTEIRETELAACEAFASPDGGFQRMDIITAFNRLSSAVYIMMCRLRGGKYGK